MVFQISSRSFVPCPIRPESIGKISSRSFAKYDSTTVPDAGYFQHAREFSNNELPFPQVVPTYRRSITPGVTPNPFQRHWSCVTSSHSFHVSPSSGECKGKRPTRILQSSSNSDDSSIDQNPVRRRPQIASSPEGSTASSQENDARPNESGNSHENTARSSGPNTVEHPAEMEMRIKRHQHIHTKIVAASLKSMCAAKFCSQTYQRGRRNQRPRGRE